MQIQMQMQNMLQMLQMQKMLLFLKLAYLRLLDIILPSAEIGFDVLPQ
jgi:hypothetical protein